MKRGFLLLLVCVAASLAQDNHGNDATSCGARAFPLTNSPDLSQLPPDALPSDNVNHTSDLGSVMTSDYQSLLAAEIADRVNDTQVNATLMQNYQQFLDETSLLAVKLADVLQNNDRVAWDDVDLSARHVLLALSAIARVRYFTRANLWFVKQVQYSAWLKAMRDLRVTILSAHVNASQALDTLVVACNNPVNQLLFGNTQCNRNAIFSALNVLNVSTNSTLNTTRSALQAQLKVIVVSLTALDNLRNAYAAALALDVGFWVNVSEDETLDNSDFVLVQQNLDSIANYQLPRWDQIVSALLNYQEDGARVLRVLELVRSHLAGYNVTNDSINCTTPSVSSDTITCHYTATIEVSTDNFLGQPQETLAQAAQRLGNVVHSFLQAFILSPRITVATQDPDANNMVVVRLSLSRTSINVLHEASSLLQGTDIQVDNATVQAELDDLITMYNNVLGATANQAAITAELVSLRTEAATKISDLNDQFNQAIQDFNQTYQENVQKLKDIIANNLNVTLAVKIVVDRVKENIQARRQQLDTAIAALDKAVTEAKIRVELAKRDLLLSIIAAALNTDQTAVATYAQAIQFSQDALAEAIRDREYKIQVQTYAQTNAEAADNETQQAVAQFEANYNLLAQGTVASLAQIKAQIRQDIQRFVRVVRAVIAAFYSSISDVEVTFGANLNDDSDSLSISFVLYDSGNMNETVSERRQKHKALLTGLLGSQCGQSDVAVFDANARKRQAVEGDKYDTTVGQASTPPPSSTTTSTTTGPNPTPNPPTSGSTPNPTTTSGNNSTPNPTTPGSSATGIVMSVVFMVMSIVLTIVF